MTPPRIAAFPLWVRIIDRISGIIGKGLGYLLAIAPAVLLAYEVVARYGFNAPTRFTIEFGLISQVLLVAAASAYVLREDGHVSMDVLSERLSPHSRKIVGVLVNLAGCGLCLLLAWLVWRSAMWSLVVNNLTETLELPLAPLQLFFVGGMILLALQFLAETWKSAAGVSAGGSGPEGEA